MLMRNHNHERKVLPPITYSLDGIEVTELHGAFGDAQWFVWLERLFGKRTPVEQLQDAWADTQLGVVVEGGSDGR